jgi:hypothetical protein
MADEPRTTLEDYDVDSAGNVELFYYDGGGGLPETVSLTRGNAAHALLVDGAHYAIEPREPDIRAEVDAMVAAMQQARKDAKKRSDDYAATVQRRADYAQAGLTLAAQRRAAAAAAPKTPTP